MKKITLLLLSLLLAAGSYAQSVGINSDGTAPEAGRMLHVKQTGAVSSGTYYGIYGEAIGAATSGDNFGVYGRAYGAANNTGVLGWVNSSGATTNIGGYFGAQQGINNYGLIVYDGDVGIGTETPTHKLHIVDARTVINSASIFIQKTGAVDGTSYGLSSTVSGAAVTNIGARFSATGAANNYGLLVENGNVGIGTTTPSQKLDVVGNGRFYNESGISKMTIQTNTSDQASIDLLNSTLSARWILDANDLFRVWNQTSAFDAFVVKANGYVGIGTTTPGGKLHIAGFGYGVVTGIAMSPVNNTQGGHYITFHNFEGTGIGSIERGAGNTIVYSTSSDYRLKENVVNIDINQAKSRLMSLRPVEYNYISDQNKTVISGFLAHEMADAGFANGVTGEKDAVDKDGNPIYQAIDTKFLIPEMVKVIQEQQAEIDALKKELEEIKKVLQYKK